MNKKEELQYSKFFIDHLNQRYGLDYITRPNDKENELDPEIDVYAISKKLPTLNLQVITRERILREKSATLHKIARATERNILMGPLIDMDIKRWIGEAINVKEKQYPKNIKNNLILLITGDIGPLFNKNYAQEIFNEFKNSEFKEIYSVHLPSASHNGQIIAIKDIFNNHGVIF